MKQALQALIYEMEYVLSCINEDKVPFDGDDFHEALRLGKEALNHCEDNLDMVKQEQGCTRSHPHEEMSKECELRTEIARFTNKLANIKQEQGEPVIKETASAHMTDLLMTFVDIASMFPTQKPASYAWERVLIFAPKQEQGEPVAWRPIETAPKDGSMILICLPRQMNIVVRAWYNKIHNFWQTDYEGEGGITRPTYFHEGDLWHPIPPLYTTPQQHTWVGLTNKEMQAVVDEQPLVSNINVYFKAIEAKLKEKNG